MDDLQLHTLGQRLDRLEQQVRWWRGVGVGAMALLALVVLLGANGGKRARIADEVRARRFVVVDEGGKPRAILGETVVCAWRRDKDAAVGLALFDSDARLRVTLGVTGEKQSGLFICDKDEMRRASLSMTTIPAVYLAGDDGVDRAWLEANGNKPTLVFRDERGNQRVVLGEFTLWSTPRGGEQYLDLKGEGESRSPSSLVLIDGDGKILWKAP